MSEQVRPRYDRVLFPIQGSEIASGQILLSHRKVFISDEIAATGSSQSIPHGLGVVPSKVLIVITESPTTYAALDVTEGTHTATNVVVTVSSGYKFKVYAEA